MRELIQLFEEGSAHIIDNVPVLDKAIDSIMNTLHNYTTHKKKTRPILH